jgi:hypothetical protein
MFFFFEITSILSFINHECIVFANLTLESFNLNFYESIFLFTHFHSRNDHLFFFLVLSRSITFPLLLLNMIFILNRCIFLLYV